MASTSYCVLHVYNSGALRYKRSLSSKENEEEATCRRRGGRDSAINGIFAGNTCVGVDGNMRPVSRVLPKNYTSGFNTPIVKKSETCDIEMPRIFGPV